MNYHHYEPLKKNKILLKTFIFLSLAFFTYSIYAAPVAESASENKEGGQNLLYLLYQGGPVMIPLVIASILALTLIIERGISLRADKIVPEDFCSDLRNKLSDFSNENLDKSLKFCDKNSSPISTILKSGILRCKSDRRFAEIEETLEDISSREVRKLKKSLDGLKIIAAISPLLGLLGTVYGMIEAFQNVATAEGVARAEKLASGIYQAMVTTASGLTIAIPVLLFYYYFNYKIDKQVINIESKCDDFILEFLNKNKDKK